MLQAQVPRPQTTILQLQLHSAGHSIGTNGHTTVDINCAFSSVSE